MSHTSGDEVSRRLAGGVGDYMSSEFRVQSSELNPKLEILSSKSKLG